VQVREEKNMFGRQRTLVRLSLDVAAFANEWLEEHVR
jgi:hypothetical protein